MQEDLVLILNNNTLESVNAEKINKTCLNIKDESIFSVSIWMRTVEIKLDSYAIVTSY